MMRSRTMSAQAFYNQAVAVPQTHRVENTDYNAVANGRVPTYYRVTQCGQQVRIKYWWFYGYQSACDAFDNGTHNGDWEQVMVTLSEDRSRVAAVTFWMHGKRYTRLADRGGFEIEEGTHPVVYVGKHSHASLYNQGGSSESCLPWEEYRNNSSGTHLDAWRNLVSLDANAEPWMQRDRTDSFSWGSDGVTTHPTREAVSCSLNAADWDDNVPTWRHSQCKSGDDDSGVECIQQCRSGYTNTGLLCSMCSGTWWNPTSWHCDTYTRNRYGYDYTLPGSDRGLLYGDF
jgi:hypothetical protein